MCFWCWRLRVVVVAVDMVAYVTVVVVYAVVVVVFAVGR